VSPAFVVHADSSNWRVEGSAIEAGNLELPGRRPSLPRVSVQDLARDSHICLWLDCRSVDSVHACLVSVGDSAAKPADS